MKKSLTLLICALILGFTTNAQFYYTRIGVAVTGSISSNRDLLYSYTSSGSGQTAHAVPVGLGRGFTGTAAFGFKPSKYIGLEIGISEFVGFPRYADSIVNFPGGTNAEAAFKGNMLSILPAVVISPGFEKIDPYARLGLVIGIRPRIYGQMTYTQASTNPPNEYKVIREYYGNAAIGLNAAMGVNWTISDLISLYAEFTFTSISYAPNYSEIILYDKNGVDQLSTLTVKQTKTEYYNSITLNEDIPDTSPNKELKKSIPFSNAGLSFGIAFHF
jgi:hypothetical protein